MKTKHSGVSAVSVENIVVGKAAKTPHSGVSAVSVENIVVGKAAKTPHSGVSAKIIHSIKTDDVAKNNFSILVLHGPNLNLLGRREPEVYGSTTLEQINQSLKAKATEFNIILECFQSNSEGELITKAGNASTDYDFIIINPAGFTHTSVALRDAILASGKPCIEVHLSNIYKREAFRHFSFFSDIAVGVISGLGEHGYNFALEYIINNYLQRS